MAKTVNNKKQKDKDKKNILLRLAKDVKVIFPGLILASLLSAGSVLCALFTPKLLGQIIDLINTYWKDSQEGLSPFLDMQIIFDLAVTLTILYGVSALLSLLKMLLMNNTVSRFFTCALRIKISDKIQRLPVSYVDKTPNGEIISRMTGDVSVMGNTVHNFLDLTIIGFLQVVAISYMMFRINWIMAAVVIAIVPISIVISSLIARKSEKYFDQTQKSFGNLYSHIEESYGGFKTVKGYNLEKIQERKHTEVNDEIAEANRRGAFLSEIVQPIIAFTNNIGYVIICLVGGYLAVKNTISVGDVVAVILYSKLFSGPLEGIATGISVLQRTYSASKRVYEILDTEEMAEVAETTPIKGKGDVMFEDVSFSYSEKKPLIQNLNLKIQSGQKIAIVGPTGAGKTTIVNLLMRFYDIQKGRILVDGVDIMSVKRSKLRDVFSMVLQETWLFSGTVYENVAYGKPNATKEEIMTACDHSYADHFIKTLPDGYETKIDESSGNLSGGQKQLLTIARAFLSDREILILDEATSNVDTRTEILIQKAMDKLMKNRTSFVIAHRLSTIIDADVILVVNDGSVVEQGKHEELLAKQGFYYEIYQSQYALIKA